MENIEAVARAMLAFLNEIVNADIRAKFLQHDLYDTQSVFSRGTERDTHLIERLESFGVTFTLDEPQSRRWESFLDTVPEYHQMSGASFHEAFTIAYDSMERNAA